MMSRFAILFLGTAVDRLVGDPDWLWRRVPHPVVLFGWVIDRLDQILNRPRLEESARWRNGVIAAGLLVGGALLAGLLLSTVFASLGLLGGLFEALVLAVFLAQKSLVDHVRAVERALGEKGLESGRRAVAMIVGRDPEALDEAGICRAAIESLAENASDGVVAPFLWYLVLGLPGLLAYKAINTADSMIGHLNDRYRAFGWASAKLDDGMNWPAARLTALLIALAAGIHHRRMAEVRAALATARRDAPLHRSPNAGWPEAAMAAALGLSLGGPRRYGNLEVEAPMLNPEGRRWAGPADIAAAIGVFRTAANLLLAFAALLFIAAAL
ncbi:adenosylcobinamide-phosphate synthase CbiB [Aurantimonas sp. A3-2-R12]|uniref:adenosylcobinamide-phosphate synthase CbiB n=1 Tax=Aurantimonas sp. A3-2-R12 TaxID=3114362 RepID=UPI002E16F394|nr:adenosylcobinamide-phosphate synthase CbiB [Aurantimonas sp. A3-2-R12]